MSPDIKTFEALSREKDKIQDDVLSSPGVTGIGIGYRIRGGKQTNELCIQVFVEKKKPLEAIKEDAFTLLFPDLPIDVLELKPPAANSILSPSKEHLSVNNGSLSKGQNKAWDIIVQACSDHRRFIRPLVGGVEIGRAGVNYVGTLGGIVFNLQSNAPCALSNWHVVANGAIAGDVICQPGNSPGPNNSMRIGTLLNAALGQTDVGWVDAGVTALDNTIQFSQNMLDIDGNSTNRCASGALSTWLEKIVVKSGRTTGVTVGRIKSVLFTTNVSYTHGTVHFENQLLILPYPEHPGNCSSQVSDGGDSGSLWLEYGSNNAIALNFAGEAPGGSDQAIANPIFAVLHSVGVKFEADRNVVYRWVSLSNGDHFYCIDPGGELAPVATYSYEGAPFALFGASEFSVLALHRWFSPNSGDHFYTTDPSGELAPAAGYRYEGVIGYIKVQPESGLVQLHRWFNPSSGDHFYTTDPNGELAPSSGYNYEGVTGWVRAR